MTNTTKDYKHTQIGYLMLTIAGLTLALFLSIILSIGTHGPTIIIMIVVTGILLSFGSLQVRIDTTHLHIKFSYGIYRKKFPLDRIASVKTVKNHWYYGWGIRLWLKPTMFIYNVSGFDAVQLTMADGRIYRIGTDEPEKLKHAILQAIKKSTNKKHTNALNTNHTGKKYVSTGTSRHPII